MNFLGIDYGEKRVGLSFADDECQVALPLDPVLRTEKTPLWAQLEEVIRCWKVDHLVLGYPVREGLEPSLWAKKVERFYYELREKFSLPVTLVNEELTSYQVEKDLQILRTPSRRNVRQKMRASGRKDSLAAVLILRDFFNGSRWEIN